MTPLLGILDDTDAPAAGMLVVVYGHPAHPTVEYVSAASRPLGLRGRFAGYPRMFTRVEDFGVRASFEPDGRLRLNQHGPSVARYPDGKHRPWQERRGGVIDVRAQVAGHVIKAVQAMRTAAATEAA